MAEDFNHIDQIIRQKFENFEPEPPIQVWDNIQSGIRKDPPHSPGIILPIVVSISLLIFLSGLIHHFTSDNNASDPLNNEASSLSLKTSSLISTGSTTLSDPALQNEFYKTPSTVPVIKTEDAARVKSSPETISVRAPFGQTPKTTAGSKATSKEPANAPEGNARNGQWKPGLVQALNAGELSYADAVKYNLGPRDIKKLTSYREYARKKTAEWSVGIYFNPEVSNFQDESFENTISYGAGILPRISFNKLFIQSGINMRFTQDKANYSVDYNRYLGSYEDVYEVTFDSTDNGVIPTYHTQTVDVYDTINHYAITETHAKYTYLEIPVLVGYRYSFGKFSLFANGGPAASFLVIRNIPEVSNPEDKARIINVESQIPVRTSVNWQMMLGAGFDYQLAGRIRFSMEPTFRFALKPEYNLPEGAKRNTTSFGIRAGLNYTF